MTPDKVSAAAPTVVYYHADCPDGFGAAFSAWLSLGPDTCLIPMDYGKRWASEDVSGRKVFVLDFSFPPEQLRNMALVAQSVVQIDHHATARDHWAECLSPPDADGLQFHASPDGRLVVRFNMRKSGARLAWEYFHPGRDVPWMIRHIEDLDLWKFTLDGTRDYCRALQLRPHDPRTWLEMADQAPGNDAYEQMLSVGQSVSRFINIEVAHLADGKNVVPCTLQLSSEQTVTGLAINASALFASDLGNVLALRSGTFGAIWHLGGNGEAQVSLRANGQVNVAKIAERYGGGGHPNAAGMRLPSSEFISTLQMKAIGT